ncbi:MAG: hypothetical protein P9X27_06730 [Candidatus Kaelpia aquatica]|nr:hypothetical protein [Candidatus Kaelpia aquatica]
MFKEEALDSCLMTIHNEIAFNTQLTPRWRDALLQCCQQVDAKLTKLERNISERISNIEEGESQETPQQIVESIRESLIGLQIFIDQKFVELRDEIVGMENKGDNSFALGEAKKNISLWIESMISSFDEIVELIGI